MMALNVCPLIICLIGCVVNHAIADTNSDLMIIKQLMVYSQYSNLLDASSNESDTDFDFDLDDFRKINENKINNAYAQNQKLCNDLHLKSAQCAKDCIYYLSPLALLVNSTDYKELVKVLNWYQMGAAPISWFNVGNPDMCSFMDGTYCYTPLVQRNTNNVIMEHGCCVPGSCKNKDAIKVLKENLWCYQSFNKTYNKPLYQKMFGVDNYNQTNYTSIKNICQPKQRNLSSPGFLIVCVIFLMFCGFVLIATIKHQFVLEVAAEDESMNGNKGNVFLYCFSMQSVWKIFLKTRPPNKSQFNFLDGIRVISLLWVIWGHVVYNFDGAGHTSNYSTLIPSGLYQHKKYSSYVLNQFYMMLTAYGDFSVDSFFFLSGFVGSFSIYRQLEKHGNTSIKLFSQRIPLSYIHRILRILPMMTFSILFVWFIYPQIPSSNRILQRHDFPSSSCSVSWYKSLLFYANFTEDVYDCNAVLWYIYCDMQMFSILPWIMLAFKWNKVYGLICSFVPIVICIALRIYISFYYHAYANEYYPGKTDMSQTVHAMYYTNPFSRMAPYFIGSFSLLLILILKQKQFEIKSRWIYFCLMAFSLFILCCLIFWPYDDVKDAPQKRWGPISNQIYYALSRPAWGFGLGLMSFCLVFKSKSISSLIGTILSFPVFQYFGKLTYTMYLFHLWFAVSLNDEHPMPNYYSLWDNISWWFSTVFVTSGTAIILWFVMEQPMANLVGLFVKYLTSTKTNDQMKKKSHPPYSKLVNDVSVIEPLIAVDVE